MSADFAHGMDLIRSTLNPIRSNRSSSWPHFELVRGMIEAPIYSATESLLNGLARFRVREVSEQIQHAPGLFSYCSITRERLTALDLQKPILGVLLSGTKEVWRGMSSHTLRPGCVFVLPAREPMDVVNLPDARTGIFQSMILEVPAAGPVIHLARADRAAPRQQTFEVSLTPQIVDTVIHAALELVDSPARPVVRQARLIELLAVLQNDPAAAALFDISTAQRVIKIIGANLARDWKAPEVASSLGMSESTLRRRLAAEGMSFARLLRQERMIAAQGFIVAQEQSQSAAALVGYSSRAHFARHFKSHFGTNPGELRRQGTSPGRTRAPRTTKAKADGRWEAAYAPASKAEVPPDFQAALDANPKAGAFFATLAGANRYAILYRIGSVKKSETRVRKIIDFIGMLERGETVHR